MLPELYKNSFQCPHCNVVSKQLWLDSDDLHKAVETTYTHSFLEYRGSIQDYQQSAIKRFLNQASDNFPELFSDIFPTELVVSTCQNCKKAAIWIHNKLVFPKQTNIDPPNDDLSDEIKGIYAEAASILQESPKGATALLRLALQKLLVQIGEKGRNINEDIKSLVSKGLSSKIQRALDLLRVVGNNAVHPGQIDLDDNAEVAYKLFKILNIIAEDIITKPKEIDDLYNDIIPEEAKNHIEQRDKK